MWDMQSLLQDLEKCIVVQRNKIYILCLLLPLTSCVTFKAYFNTFYNARKIFRDTEELYKKNNYQLNAQIKRNYENAIKKFLYVVKYYPSSPFVDDALYYTSICYLRLEEYVKSIKKFEELLKYAPESKFCILAFDKSSEVLLEKERFDDFEYIYLLIRDMKIFEKLKQEKRMFYEVNFEFLKQNYDNVVLKSEEFLKRYKKSELKDKVAEILVRSYLENKMEDKALSFLNEFYSEEKPEKLPVSYYITLSDIYISKGDTSKAIETLENIYRKSSSPEVFFKLIGLKKLKGESKEKMRTMLLEFKDKTEIDSLKQKALFEIAKTYDERDSLEKKEEVLKEITKISSFTEYGKRANNYLSILEKLKKMNEKEDRDIKEYLSLAEDYYIELSKPLYTEYFLKKAVQIDDSIYTPKAYYFLFFIQKVILNKNEEANKTFEELQEKYPDSFYIEEIRRRLEVP